MNGSRKQRPLKSVSECFIQIQEKALVAKFPKSIVQRQVGTGGFIKQDAQPGAISLAEGMKKRCAMQVIAALKVAKYNATKKLIFQDREAEFHFSIIELRSFEVLGSISPSTAETAISPGAGQFNIGHRTAQQVIAPIPESQYGLRVFSRKRKIFSKIGGKQYGVFGTAQPALVDAYASIGVNTFVGTIGIVARDILNIKQEPIGRILVLRENIPVVIDAGRRSVFGSVFLLDIAPYLKRKTGTYKKIWADILIDLLTDIIINGTDGIDFVCIACKYGFCRIGSRILVTNAHAKIGRYCFCNNNIALQIPFIARRKYIVVDIKIQDALSGDGC